MNRKVEPCSSRQGFLFWVGYSFTRTTQPFFKVLSIIDRIQEDMLILSEYFRLNRLCLNGSKSIIVHLHSVRRKLPMLKEIVIDGSVIETVTAVKYLGVILDQNLSWRIHVFSLCKSLLSKVVILNRLRFFCFHLSQTTILCYFSILNQLPVWDMGRSL